MEVIGVFSIHCLFFLSLFLLLLLTAVLLCIKFFFF